MKSVILIFAILYLTFGCNQVVQEKKDKVVFSEVEGSWILSNYIDTILEDKSVNKHRMGFASSWFATFIYISKDSISFVGTMKELPSVSYNLKDTLCVLPRTGYGSWGVRYDHAASRLCLFSKNGEDDVLYYYTRFQENQRDLDYNALGDHLSLVYAKEIISNVYFRKDNKDKVVFYENGSVVGLEGYSKYVVDNGFGTLRPYGNNDIIYFYDSLTQNTDVFKWEFKGDNLILYSFKEDSVYKGERYHIKDMFIELTPTGG